MVSTQYFVIRPKRALVALLHQAGASEDLSEAELWSKKQHDRIRERPDEVMARIRKAFVDCFRERLSMFAQHDSSFLSRLDVGQFTPVSFDEFWEIEVFEDCEDLERIEKQLPNH